MKVLFQPIGTIHTPFTKREGMPIQPSRAKDTRGTVEVLPEYAEGLADLEGFSHIFLLYHFHRSTGHRLKVVPFLDAEEHGVFATRAPSRPNALGLSLVGLISIEENLLSVEGVDILDGTPLLDIKPYVPEFDTRMDVRIG
jgi:tRNA-Thr(GGU) m(6)t(6)A37 methyltransferase TsaA